MTQGAESPAEKPNNTNAMPRTSEPVSANNAGDFMDEESVIGFDALYDSMLKTKKGVLWKDSVAAYYHRGIERTEKLCDDLHNGKYKPSPPKHFMITSPKPREIASIAYRDRVYQRSLNDNVVYPVMTKSFIYDNHACQKGKGTDFARNRMNVFLRKYYRKHGNTGYVAQFDIHGYYPSMSHERTEELFKEKLPEWAYDRVVRILREQYDGDVGYNPGSQLIQIAGISMLDKIDHYIKERIHAKYYIRYMDDLIIIHHDKGFLEGCQAEINKRLNEIGFEINWKKTGVYSLDDGIMFLGFRYLLTGTGKILMFADPKRIKAGRKKYRRLVAKAKRGEIPKGNVDQSFATWIQHISKGNSYHLTKRLTEYYNDLWRKDDSNDSETQNNVPG